MAVCLLLAAAATLWVTIVNPMIDWYDRREHFLDGRMMLARQMAALSPTVPILHRHDKNEAANSASSELLLVGRSDAEAGAELIQHVEDIVKQTGCNLLSVETVEAQDQASYRIVALRVSLLASWSAMVSFFEAAQQANPPMLIDKLDLQADRAIQPSQARQLHANFELFSFRRGAGADNKP
jgi:hypothetical protein